MDRAWLMWAIDIGLLPNIEEAFILLGWTLVGLVATFLYKRFMRQRIDSTKNEQKQAEASVQQEEATSTELDPPVPQGEPGKIEEISPTPVASAPAEAAEVAPPEIPPEDPEIRVQVDPKGSLHLQPGKKGKKDNSVPVMRKVLAHTGMFISAMSPSKSKREGGNKKSKSVSKPKPSRIKALTAGEDDPAVGESSGLHEEGGKRKRGLRWSSKISPKLLSPQAKSRRAGDPNLD